MVIDFLTKSKSKEEAKCFIDEVKQEKDTFFNTIELPIGTPYPFSRGCAVEYHGELHIFGGEDTCPHNYSDQPSSVIKYYHYKFDGEKWIQLSKIPGQYYYGSSYSTLEGEEEYNIGIFNAPAVVYNDKILISLRDSDYGDLRYLYEWDGTDWKKSDIPFIDSDYCNQINFVYNGVLHAMTPINNRVAMDNFCFIHHYYYDGTQWIQLSDIPINDVSIQGTPGSICVYNNKIHYFALKKPSGTSSPYYFHYECGTNGQWTSSFELPIDFSKSFGKIITINNKLYCLYSNGIYGSDNCCSIFNDIDNKWEFYTYLPYLYFDVYSYNIAACNDKLYIIGGFKGENWNYEKNMYELDMHSEPNNLKWSDEIEFSPGHNYPYYAFNFNNDIYMIGYSSDMGEDYLFNFKDDELQIKASLPVSGDSINAVAASDDEFYIITSDSFYKFKTSSFEEVSNLPYNFYEKGAAVIFKNELHILSPSTSTEPGTHYQWDSSKSEWILISNLPYTDSYTRLNAVVYNNEIHLFSRKDPVQQFHSFHYKWDGSKWEILPEPPFPFHGGPLLVYNNVIHIFGAGYYSIPSDQCEGISSYNSRNYLTHFIWDGKNYKEFEYFHSDMAYRYCEWEDYRGIAVESDGDIYLMQKNHNAYYKLPATEYEKAIQPGVNLAKFIKTTFKSYIKV